MSKKHVQLNLGVYALIWSLIIGIITAAYLNLVNWCIDLIWHDFLHGNNDLANWYPFIVCIPAGLLIGFLRKQLGDYPLTIEEVLTKVRLQGHLDYHHWWYSFVLGLLVLTSGASVGPEASTTVITSSMINWLGDRLRWANYCSQSGKSINIWCAKLNQTDLGKAPAFKQLFRSRLQQRIVTLILVVVGIVGAAIVFKLFPEEGVFGIHHHAISWQWQNLLTAIPTMAAGLAFGWLFIHLENWAALIINVKWGPIVQAAFFGLILAVSALLSRDILFSGEFRIVPFTHEALTMTVPCLLMVAVVKAVITNLGFVMGWRGGTIFPAIFSSLAIGVACALLLPGDVRVNAIIVLTTSLTVILRKPLLVSVLLILLVPIELTPVIIITALLVNWLLTKLAH